MGIATKLARSDLLLACARDGVVPGRPFVAAKGAVDCRVESSTQPLASALGMSVSIIGTVSSGWSCTYMDPRENSPYPAAEGLAYISACSLGSCFWFCLVRNRSLCSCEESKLTVCPNCGMGLIAGLAGVLLSRFWDLVLEAGIVRPVAIQAICAGVIDADASCLGAVVVCSWLFLHFFLMVGEDGRWIVVAGRLVIGGGGYDVTVAVLWRMLMPGSLGNFDVRCYYGSQPLNQAGHCLTSSRADPRVPRNVRARCDT